MQHFPPIAQSSDPIRVPYLRGRYSGHRFETFLTDQIPDLNFARLQRGDLCGVPQSTVAKLLQSWLFFGLLSETLQLEVRVDDFVEQDTSEAGTSQQWITTARLRSYLRRWRAQHEGATTDPASSEAHLSEASTVLQSSFAIWSGFEDFTSIVDPEIELSIQLLGSALEHAVESLSQSSPGRPYPARSIWEASSWRRTRSILIERRMIRNGWCPTVVGQLGRPTMLALQAYVSLLKPWSKPNFEAHAHCQVKDPGCQAVNVDQSRYLTRHAIECNCEAMGSMSLLHINMDELRETLSHGGIPIVYLDEKEGYPQLKVTRHVHSRQYTAISHV